MFVGTVRDGRHPGLPAACCGVWAGRGSVFRLLSAVVLLALSGAAFGGRVAVTVVHTCDLHGHILPITDYEGNAGVGGLARCATVIRELRKSHEHVVLVDAGDTIQGSPASRDTRGRMMVRALEHLGYDGWVIGNHEFDWGQEVMADCILASQVPVLYADLVLLPEAGVDSRAARIASRVKPFVMKRVTPEVDVALIGIGTPGIPKWSRPHLFPGLSFADSAKTLREQHAAARAAGAEIVVAVVHQGWRDWGDDHANRVGAMVQACPEVDAIIGGHTHRVHAGVELGEKPNTVLYTQAGYHGIGLGVLEFEYDTQAGAVVKRQGRVLSMHEGIPLDEELLALCREDLDRAAVEMDKMIGTVGTRLHGEGGVADAPPLFTLLCEAIRQGVEKNGGKVDAVLHGLFTHDTVFEPGAVLRVRDAWTLMPYENTVGVLEVCGADLRKILEDNASQWKRVGFKGVYGLRVRMDPTAKPGQRLRDVRWPDGRPVKDTDRVRLAANSYDLAGGGGRSAVLRTVADQENVRVTEYDFLTRDALVAYIRAQGRVRVESRAWLVFEGEDTGAGAAPATGPW